MMKRIILHWTAGTHTPNTSDRQHYHFTIAGDGRVVEGLHPVAANVPPLGKQYAAHTSQLNSNSIGVAVAAMRGAQSAPFSAGSYPITRAQIDALAVLVARLAREYDIPITRETILTHAEVQPTLGVRQAGKWDIRWLPGMSGIGEPVKVGDMLRERIRQALRPLPAAPAPMPVPPSPPGFLARLLSLIFGRRT